MSCTILENQKVLIVDDDRVITATLAEGLRKAGITNKAVNSASEARDAIKKDNFDLAVIDSKMPEESGVDFASWLSQEKPNIPFLFLSSYGDEKMIQEAISAGAMTYLIKPVQISQLVAVVYSALKRGKQIVDLHSQTEKLKTALDNNRDINVAVGMLMNRFGLTRDQAFESLRRRSRDEQIRTHDLASRLIECEEIVAEVGHRLQR